MNTPDNHKDDQLDFLERVKSFLIEYPFSSVCLTLPERLLGILGICIIGPMLYWLVFSSLNENIESRMASSQTGSYLDYLVGLLFLAHIGLSLINKVAVLISGKMYMLFSIGPFIFFVASFLLGSIAILIQAVEPSSSEAVGRPEFISFFSFIILNLTLDSGIYAFKSIRKDSQVLKVVATDLGERLASLSERGHELTQ